MLYLNSYFQIFKKNKSGLPKHLLVYKIQQLQPFQKNWKANKIFYWKTILKNYKPLVCAFHGGSHVIKKMAVKKEDNVICAKTAKKLSLLRIKASKKDLSGWKKYIHCMIEKYPLRKCAKECDILLSNAFI